MEPTQIHTKKENMKRTRSKSRKSVFAFKKCTKMKHHKSDIIKNVHGGTLKISSDTLNL